MKKTSTWDMGLRCGYLVPMTDKETFYKNYFIGISKDQITFVGPYKKNLETQSKKFLDFSNHIVLPGLINAHTHLGMSLFRGVEDNLNLHQWLFDKIFPLEEKFVTPSFVELGTKLSAYECIRFGTTCVSDMYFYPEKALSVWDKMGLRGIFGQPLISFKSPENKSDDNSKLFKKFETLKQKYSQHPRLGVSLAPHAPYTCSKELLQKVREYQKKHSCLVHIHLAETQAEVQDVTKKHNLSPTAYLYSLELLNKNTLCAHAVHTSENDQNLLAKSGASLVHNPDSNFKLGSGIAPIVSYLNKDINVALGTDGAASNNDLSLFGAMDLMAKGQKVLSSDISEIKTGQVLWASTQGGAKALGLEKKIGSVEVGKQADIIAVDLKFAHLRPLSNPLSHLVFSTQGLEVDSTLVAGKILMKNKKILLPGFEQTLKKAQSQRDKIETFLKNKTKK